MHPALLRFVLPAVAAASALCMAPAHADVEVHTYAQAPAGDTGSVAEVANPAQAWAHSMSDLSSATSWWRTTEPCPPGSGSCSTTRVGPNWAEARAAAIGPRGVLRVGAVAHGTNVGHTPESTARAAITDTLTFTGASRAVDVLFRIEQLNDGVTDDARAELWFGLDVLTGVADNPRIPFLVVRAWDITELPDDSRGYEVLRALPFGAPDPEGDGDGMAVIDSGTGSIKTRFELTADFGMACAPGFPCPDTVTFQAWAMAETECHREMCEAHALAEQSAYIGVRGPFVSAEGFAYDAYAAAIPEPSSAALLLAGGLVVMGWRRRLSISKGR